MTWIRDFNLHDVLNLTASTFCVVKQNTLVPKRMNKKRISKWTNLGEAKVIDGKNTVEMFIDGVIGGDFWGGDDGNAILTKEEMRNELLVIGSIAAEKIIVNISSFGGSVDHALAMHDLLKKNKAEIETNVFGMTASAATIIAQAADKGLRKISDNALYLVHCGSSCAFGNKFDAKMFLQDVEAADGRISNIYSKAGGKTQAEYMSLMERNNGEGEWLSPEQALEEKLVDEIYEPKKIAAVVIPSEDFLKAMSLPKITDEKIAIINNKSAARPLKNSVMPKAKTTIKNATPEEITVMNQCVTYCKSCIDSCKTCIEKVPSMKEDCQKCIDQCQATIDAMVAMGAVVSAPAETQTGNVVKIGNVIQDKDGKEICSQTIVDDKGNQITTNEKGIVVAIAPKKEEVIETPEQKIKNLEAELEKVKNNVVKIHVIETKVEKGDDPNLSGSNKNKNAVANDLNAAALRE